MRQHYKKFIIQDIKSNCTLSEVNLHPNTASYQNIMIRTVDYQEKEVNHYFRFRT